MARIILKPYREEIFLLTFPLIFLHIDSPVGIFLNSSSRDYMFWMQLFTARCHGERQSLLNALFFLWEVLKIAF